MYSVNKKLRKKKNHHIKERRGERKRRRERKRKMERGSGEERERERLKINKGSSH